ncbi:carboxymuconolactone decarboxylase family protein [Crossiella sp. SN42]|uniref:carboxymuconolactone decarboxylase family protein n=1 Tax=Crossiella sp. SN42 TaxID=2944808 RepID=UPI00207CBBCA|nr:carboxymuconolactone decarboxylase family protein [Crossiella sp. SN42]MCO1578312.1 carboxymuconolactone decarboxylase family protein [Crossiella sp. SN42]
MPDYAADIRANLESVLGDSVLSEQRLWGAVVAVAVTSGRVAALGELVGRAERVLSAEAFDAARSAGAVMAMNNVFYRAKHQLADEEYRRLPARLRMRVVARPGVDKADFELWCVAVSAVNGCRVCLELHERKAREAGAEVAGVHEVLRVAAVVHAAGVVLAAERDHCAPCSHH